MRAELGSHITLLATGRAPAFLSEYKGKPTVLVSRGVTWSDFKRPFYLSNSVVTKEALKNGRNESRKKATTEIRVRHSMMKA